MVIGPCTNNSQNDTPGAFHVLFRQSLNYLHPLLVLFVAAGVVKPRKVNQSQLWLIRARDLDFKHIIAESRARGIGAGKSHTFLRIFDQCGKVTTGGKGLGGEGSELLLFLLVLPGIPRLNVYFDSVAGVSAKNNFRRKASADIVFGWKAHPGDCLQYRAFSTRLITTDDDLRQFHETSNSNSAQLVNLVQQL